MWGSHYQEQAHMTSIDGLLRARHCAPHMHHHTESPTLLDVFSAPILQMRKPRPKEDVPKVTEGQKQNWH